MLVRRDCCGADAHISSNVNKRRFSRNKQEAEVALERFALAYRNALHFHTLEYDHIFPPAKTLINAIAS